jgi:hypothetical protein
LTSVAVVVVDMLCFAQQGASQSMERTGGLEPESTEEKLPTKLEGLFLLAYVCYKQHEVPALANVTLTTGRERHLPELVDLKVFDARIIFHKWQHGKWGQRSGLSRPYPCGVHIPSPRAVVLTNSYARCVLPVFQSSLPL